MAIIVGVPRLSRRLRLPSVVGLLLCGVLIGPHVLGIFPVHPSVADFFADLGKLLLMFFAGLEIDLALFRRTRTRSMVFGLLTTGIPLALGTAVGLWFGYQPVAAIVLGSLLPSHTLLALPIVSGLGETGLEPVTVTVGATVLSDTLSLIVYASCAGIYHSGFSLLNLGVQLIEIAIFVPLVLFGLSRVGAYLLKKLENDEDSYFILMLGIMGVAGVLAHVVNLPGIVGAFLAGLAVNSAVHDKPAKGKLEFVASTLFIPIFFIVTGFLIDPLVFVRSLIDNFAFACGVILALLVGKWIAAEVAGRAFHYNSAERLTIWSLTLPQVAATLAATLAAYDTFNSAGQRLVDSRAQRGFGADANDSDSRASSDRALRIANAATGEDGEYWLSFAIELVRRRYDAMRRFGYIAASLAVALTLYVPVIAQDSSADSQSQPPDATATVSSDQQPTGQEEPTSVKTGASVSSQELANQVNNPAAPVTFIQFRDILLPNPSKTKGAVNALQMQPVLPIGPFQSFPHVQLMKITLPMVLSTPGIAPPIGCIVCGSGNARSYRPGGSASL